MAQADAQQAPTSAQRAALQVTIRGRIDHVTKREVQGRPAFRTIVKTPAPDEFSSPGTFEVRSAQRLGSPGEDCSVLCLLRGYGRNYTNKDGDTVRSAEHVFEAL
jgi:hypothetical protein